MTPRAAHGASFVEAGRELTPGDGARIGTIDFKTWFATHPLGARR